MEWQHKRHEQGQIGDEQGIRVDSLLKLDVHFRQFKYFPFFITETANFTGVAM